MGLFAALGGTGLSNALGNISSAAQIGSNIAGLFGGGSGSAKRFRNEQMDFAQEQFAYQKQLNDNGIQMKVEDMKRAGLNPILAAQSGLSSGSSASTIGVPAT